MFDTERARKTGAYFSGLSASPILLLRQFSCLCSLQARYFKHIQDHFVLAKACNQMARRRRWQIWMCPLLLSIGVAYVLYSLIAPGNTGISSHLPFAVKGSKVYYHKTENSKHTLTLYDPFSRDYSDSIGIKGLQGFDCVRAIEGFPVSFSEKSSPVIPLSDEAFIERTKDCSTFRERYGYHRYGHVTEEERSFPLAFNILLYKEVAQLHLLLRAIYRPHNSYCLHVDGHAAPQVFEATRRLTACVPNVFLASRRENITYSGFSRLQADLNCMEDHWRRSVSQRVPWRYLFNLPSQDFPLKSNLEMVKILTIYNGSNDIEGITGNRMLKNRFVFKHKLRLQAETGRLQVVRTEEKHEPAPHNISVVKGSAYGIFSRAFVHYVLHDQRAKDLLNWCRVIDSPDEYFWATLHHNPHLHVPGGYNGVPDQKPWLAVYASWPPRDPCRSGKHVRGVCIFGVQDLPHLVSRQEFFANKFYLDFQPETLHCLDQWLVNKSRAAMPVNTYYYRQLPFIIS